MGGVPAGEPSCARRLTVATSLCVALSCAMRSSCASLNARISSRIAVSAVTMLLSAHSHSAASLSAGTRCNDTFGTPCTAFAAVHSSTSAPTSSSSLPIPAPRACAVLTWAISPLLFLLETPFGVVVGSCIFCFVLNALSWRYFVRDCFAPAFGMNSLG